MWLEEGTGDRGSLPEGQQIIQLTGYMITPGGEFSDQQDTLSIQMYIIRRSNGGI